MNDMVEYLDELRQIGSLGDMIIMAGHRSGQYLIRFLDGPGHEVIVHHLLPSATIRRVRDDGKGAWLEVDYVQVFPSLSALIDLLGILVYGRLEHAQLRFSLE